MYRSATLTPNESKTKYTFLNLDESKRKGIQKKKPFSFFMDSLKKKIYNTIRKKQNRLLSVLLFFFFYLFLWSVFFMFGVERKNKFPYLLPVFSLFSLSLFLRERERENHDWNEKYLSFDFPDKSPKFVLGKGELLSFSFALEDKVLCKHLKRMVVSDKVWEEKILFWGQDWSNLIIQRGFLALLMSFIITWLILPVVICLS